MILESLLASVIAPAAVDIAKGLFGALSRRFAGLSVDDQIKLDTADMERLKALAALDSPIGSPSQWVVDLRASFRYIAAPLVIVIGTAMAWYGATQSNEQVIEMGLSLATMPFGFIFGERMYLGFKGSKR